MGAKPTNRLLRASLQQMAPSSAFGAPVAVWAKWCVLWGIVTMRTENIIAALRGWLLIQEVL